MKIRKITKKQIIKFMRKDSREMELELYGNRWIVKHKIHKSDKTYSRKNKHKGND